MPRLIPILTLLISSSGLLSAQYLYLEAELNSKLTDTVDLSILGSSRYDEEQELSDYFTDLGISYAFLDDFYTGITYRRGRSILKDDVEADFHRWCFDVGYKENFHRLGYDVRIRYQQGSDPEDEDLERFLRCRLKLDYKIKWINLKPYLSLERYQDLEKKQHAKDVWSLGFKWKATKSLKCSIEYKDVHKIHKGKDYDAYTFSISYDL